MAKYQRVPPDVEAEQWDGKSETILGLTLYTFPDGTRGIPSHRKAKNSYEFLSVGAWVVVHENGKVETWPDEAFHSLFKPATSS